MKNNKSILIRIQSSQVLYRVLNTYFKLVRSKVLSLSKALTDISLFHVYASLIRESWWLHIAYSGT